MNAICVAVVGLAMLCSMATGAHGQTVSSEDAVGRGRALYQSVTALAGPLHVGGTRLPASAGACVNCHGARGQGGIEAGVKAPGISWRLLTQPNADRPAYESAPHILQAIEGGLNPYGRRLALPMPTYALTEAEREGLLAYLQVIGTEADQAQGVSPQSLKIGAVLPLRGSGRSRGERIHAGLRERFAAINRAGGIYGRRLELIVEDAGTGSDGVVYAVDRIIEQHRVFALVGSFLPELPAASLGTIQRHRTPVVATLGVPLHEATARDLTYLLPSIEWQVQQLMREVRAHCDIGRGLHVLHGPIPGLAEIIQATIRPAVGDADALVHVVRSAADIPAALQKPIRGTVIALASNETVQATRSYLQERTTPTCLATLATFSGLPLALSDDSPENPALLREVVGLPMSLPAASVEVEGKDVWTVLADVSARILAEALSRTGRVVDYEAFDRALHSLQGFEPISGVSVKWTSHHRHGLADAYIWRGVSHVRTE